MNLENICNLVKASGQSRAIITIDTDGDQAVVIVNIPTANVSNLSKAVSDTEMKLRSALSTPLRVIGSVEGVDATFDEQLAQYGDGFAPASLKLNGVKSNASAAQAKTSAVAGKAPKKLKAAAQNETPAAPKPKKDKVEKTADKPTEKPQEESQADVTPPTDDNFDFFTSSAL
ncbi:PRTRC system protein E [Vibrio crassostreae]|nr:conserved hypothetical protein [Vibrio chagasii]CAK2860236.1 PRTRC system protein E [Vibrio crassostreae]